MKLPNGYGSVTKLSGNRRKPYLVRKTSGWHYDPKTDRQVQDYVTIGYAKTKAEGLKMLAEYNESPVASDKARITFSQVYDLWSKAKYKTISRSMANAYKAGYKSIPGLYNKVFRELKLPDLQHAVDISGKNYPTLVKIKSLYSQLYKFAIKNDICNKDYSMFVDVSGYKDRNPNSHEHKIFTTDEINKLWRYRGNIYVHTVLMLIYTGVRVSELLDLKKSDVHLEDRYFDIIDSKTENGIRKVPIADKIMPSFKLWYKHCPESEYLLSGKRKQHFIYKIYYQNYFKPTMKMLDLDHLPHDTRHTFISMLAEAKVDQTTIKLLVGHSGAMSLTERVYTHLDLQTLLDAVNKI